MDREEAQNVADERLQELRSLSYAELRRQYTLDEGCKPSWERRTASSGVEYQLKLYAYWDGDTPNLRVFVDADDGSRLGFALPVARTFIIAPDGSFIGE